MLCYVHAKLFVTHCQPICRVVSCRVVSGLMLCLCIETLVWIEANTFGCYFVAYTVPSELWCVRAYSCEKIKAFSVDK